jgi:hypothetical protein
VGGAAMETTFRKIAREVSAAFFAADDTGIRI